MRQQYQLMSKTYRQLYKLQQELQTGIASNYGYALNPPSLDNKPQRLKLNNTPKLANITLRQFTRETPKTQRIQQVEAEIKALHNQRKLMEQNQKAAQAAINGQPAPEGNKIMQWVDEKIEEYNNIIEHKHLINPPKTQRRNNQRKNKQHRLKTPPVTSRKTPETAQDRIALWAERKMEEYLPQTPPPEPVTRRTLLDIKKGHQQLLTPEQIIQEIEIKRQQLHSADLTHQISLNREIAALYRQFYEGGWEVKPGDINKTRSMATEPPRSMHQHASDKIIQDLPYRTNRFNSYHLNISSSDANLESDNSKRKSNSREGDYKTGQIVNKFKQAQYKKYYTTNRKTGKEKTNNNIGQAQESSRQSKREKQTNLQAPYLDKKELERYRAMQSKILSNGQALQLWRSKVQDASNNSRAAKKLHNSSLVKKRQELKQASELQRRIEELDSIIGTNLQQIGMDQSSNTFAKEYHDLSIRREQEKEDILAQLLKKRNCKFNKLWGTKILVKYDAKQEAKHMLRGEGDKTPKGATGEETSRSETAKPALDQEAAWMQEEMNEEHYWRMCKNQKINLLLKRR